MTREEFIARNSPEEVLETMGVVLRGNGDEKTGKCPLHPDRNPSLSVNVKYKVWKCFAGCGGGSVIDLIMKYEGLNYEQFAKKYHIERVMNYTSVFQKQKAAVTTTSTDAVIDTIYPYQDAFGNEVYQVVRFKPKTFRPRRQVAGRWVWGLNGVERVLFRLPDVIKSDTVILTEGERDALSLAELGYVSTTSPGGCNGWLNGYAEHLAKKNIVICGDNDEPGKQYVRQVFDSLAGKAETVKIIEVPCSTKDVTDYISTFKTKPEAKQALDSLIHSAHPFIKGYKISVRSFVDMESDYIRHANTVNDHCVDLSKWLPSLKILRPLVPGDLAVVIGNTGAGKTAVLSSIALSVMPLPTLMFELELPAESIFERFVAAKRKLTCREVEHEYANGRALGEDALAHFFKNLYVSTESGISLAEVEQQVTRAELKMGVRPKLVVIDYLQLLKGRQDDRYERMSDIAEHLKVLAKQLGIILIVGSQVHRPREGDKSVNLHSAKDSGGIENSCGLLLGIELEDQATLRIKVLKSTKDGCGRAVTCNFDGAKMTITERAYEHVT